MIFLKKIRPALFFTFLFLGAGALYHSANAQGRVEFATTRDVVIAFYKTGGTLPNFENWIKKRPPYNETPWAHREAMLEKEGLKLLREYQNFNPETDFLNVRTSVNLTPSETINANKQPAYNLSIRFDQAPDAQYFPYEFLGERFILLPRGMRDVMNVQITPSQYQFLTDAKADNRSHTMIMSLRAYEADLSQPHEIDGLFQWVLKTDIVSLEVWNRRGRLLWEHTAPWYTSPNNIKLNKLYNDKPTNSSERGAVKALSPALIE